MILNETERSTYVDAAGTDWEPTPFPGVWNKVLIFEQPNEFVP